MAFDRSAIKSGPAILTFGGASLYFKNGLTIEHVIETFNAEVDAFLGVDARVRDSYIEIKGTPAGQWTDLGVWFPWLTAARGARAHGASDAAAVVHFMDGDKYTFHNAALVGMPGLMLSHTATILDGSVTMQARVKNNTLASSANSVYTRATGQTFNDTSFDWADVLTPSLALSWGSSPWDAFYTQKGVKISATPKWSPVFVDGVGIVTQELDGLEVSATFAPIGIADSAIDAKLAMQGSANALPGARRASVADDLIIQGTGLYVLVRNAHARKAGWRSGTGGTTRHGDLEAVASLELSTGAPLAQLYLGTEAPV